MPFTVIVSDNFHDMDAGESYKLGPFEKAEDAIAASKEIVDDFLASAYRPGITPAHLCESYAALGETPYIVSSEGVGTSFSALDYAKHRCEILCAAGPGAE